VRPTHPAATESSALALGTRSGLFRVWGRVSVGVALYEGAHTSPSVLRWEYLAPENERVAVNASPKSFSPAPMLK
jgi:hypothetical protein